MIIRLGPDDRDRLMAIRATALAGEPWAFGSAPGDDRLEDPALVDAMLADPSQAVFGGILGDDLVAMAGIKRVGRIKHPHLAGIWGVYTRPEHRGRGLGRGVTSACIDRARTWAGVEVVTLSVSERNPGARRLYESLGFVVWGTEPDCTRIGDESAGEHHMRLVLGHA